MVRVVVIVGLVACGGSTGTPADAPASSDGAIDGGFAIECDQPLPVAAPIRSTEPVRMNDTCAAAPRLPPPTQGCRLDLRTLAAGDPSTCGAPLDSPPVEIDGPTQLPIVIDLPETARDPACVPACTRGGDVPNQTFGFRLRVTVPLAGGPFLSVRVDPPWYVVAGDECGETVCANGSPSINEFGSPLACVFTYCHELGVVTADPAPQAARLTIDTSDTSNEYSNCCLYPIE